MIKVVIGHDVCRASFMKFQAEAIRLVRTKSFSTNEIFTTIAHLAHEDIKSRFGNEVKMALSNETNDLSVTYYREFPDDQEEDAMLFKLGVA